MKITKQSFIISLFVLPLFFLAGIQSASAATFTIIDESQSQYYDGSTWQYCSFTYDFHLNSSSYTIGQTITAYVNYGGKSNAVCVPKAVSVTSSDGLGGSVSAGTSGSVTSSALYGSAPRSGSVDYFVGYTSGSYATGYRYTASFSVAPLVVTVNGACSSPQTHYACLAGTSSSNVDGATSWTWSCVGSGAGITSFCSQAKPVTGACDSTTANGRTYAYGSTSYSPYPQCSKGSPSTTAFPAAGSSVNWTCSGLFGGASSGTCTASQSPQPRDGVCGSSNTLSFYTAPSTSLCSVTFATPSVSWTGTIWSWSCTGSNGGATASCSANKKVDGSCSATHYSCVAGTSTNNVNGASSYTWSCLGLNGGITAPCTEVKQINGVCSSTHYNCSTGTSVNNVDGASSWTWGCNGSNGGTSTGSSACVEAKASCSPPTPLWGSSIPSGSSVTAYQTSSVVSPSTCVSQTRTCTNGVLSGSYTNQSCTVTYPAPTATITASPTSLSSGSRSTLTWSSTNATSCTSSSNWFSQGATSGSRLTDPISVTSTFTLSCTGPGGTANASVTVTVIPPASCAPPTPLWGGYIANGTSVTAYQTSSVVSPSTCVSQTRTCTNGVLSGSYTNQSCTVTYPAPTATISASPNPVTSGGRSTLTWSSTNATSCTSGGPWFSQGATSGTGLTDPVTSDTTFTLSCTGPGGTANDSVTVGVKVNGVCSATHNNCTAGASVNPSSTSSTYTWVCAGLNGGTSASCTEYKAPTATLTATSPITSGGRSTLTWSSTNATSCTAPSGNWSNSGTLSGSGLTDSLSANTTFTFQCTGPGGTSPLQSATVTVNPLSSCPPPTPLWGSYIANGASVTAYQTSSVTSPSSCVSQTRTCTNGTLSGSYLYQTCTVNPAAALSITVSPANYPVTLPNSTISATYTLVNGTSANTNCRLLDYASTPITAYSSCTGSMSVTAPTTAGGGVYGYSVQANKSATGETVTSNAFTVTVNTASSCGNGANNPPACTTCTAPQVMTGGVCTNPAPPSEPAPTATLSADAYTISSDESTTLRWNSTNATSCAFAGTPVNGISTGGATTGNVSTGSLTSTQNYQIDCQNASGVHAYASATVTVLQPSVFITADPTRVQTGDHSLISWGADGVTSCSVTSSAGRSLANGNASHSHNFESASSNETITSQTTFTISCHTGGGPDVSQSVTVNILPIFQEF